MTSCGKFLNIFLVLLLISSDLKAEHWAKRVFKPRTLNPCDISFISHLNGHIPANLKSAPQMNLWDPRFDALEFSNHLKKTLKGKNEKLEVLKDLKRLVYNDQDLVDNISEIGTQLVKSRQATAKEVERILLDRSSEKVRFYYSSASKSFHGKINVDFDKEVIVNSFMKSQEIPESLKKEYKSILLYSNRSLDEIEFAIENGLRLRGDKKSLARFRDYMDFVETMSSRQAKRALKNIDEIYDFSFRNDFVTYSTSFMRNPRKRFLIQKSRQMSYQKRRLARIEKQLLKDNNGKALNKAMRRKARNQAEAESKIFGRLLNGCNGKGGKSLKSAAKKFGKFKFSLSLVGVPTFYYMKNRDKLNKDSPNYDRYWFERLGYELGISLLFTAVGNKVFTNTNTSFWSKHLGSFWGKYFEAYAKFGALDVVNAYGYDSLFGATGYASYIQKLYRQDVSETPLEAEFSKIKNSPNFKKDVKELYRILEERSKDNNLKNWLNDNFNLYTYKSGDDKNRLTQEDLETEEGKEMMLELLAEKMYAENMGDWEEFQSGNHGMDRWLFYRARNSFWDIKGLLLNLAIFQIMCREPLGAVGSWGLILGMVIANEALSGDFTYEYRREAINQ